MLPVLTVNGPCLQSANNVARLAPSKCLTSVPITDHPDSLSPSSPPSIISILVLARFTRLKYLPPTLLLSLYHHPTIVTAATAIPRHHSIVDPITLATCPTPLDKSPTLPRTVNGRLLCYPTNRPALCIKYLFML